MFTISIGSFLLRLILFFIFSFILAVFLEGDFLFVCFYFKFWGTCAERAGLLHRYTCTMVYTYVVVPINPSSTLGISPNAIPPLAPHPLTGPSV